MAYIFYSEQPAPLNTMSGPPIEVSSGKASFSSESETEEADFIASLSLKPIFVKPIQIVQLKIVTLQKPQNDQACSTKATSN